MMIDVETKLAVFREFLDCSGVSLWHYDGEERLLSGNPERQELETLFRIGGAKQQIFSFCRENALPGFCSDAASLLWLAVPKHIQTVLTDVYVIGPVFGSATSEQTLSRSLGKLQSRDAAIQKASDILRQIPIVQHTLLVQYGVMLHRCLTDKKLEPADFQLISASPDKHRPASSEEALPSREGTYALECQIFQAVEDGNILYRHPQDVYGRKTGDLAKGDPLRHAKNEVIAAITLVTRAAIRGGLPEETAYTLSDWYIQMAESADSVAQAYQYSQDAFQDYTQRVHRVKLAAGRSRGIQECMSYIEVHLQEKLTLERLAETLGYSKNYLSAKFSQEVGVSIGDYITLAKMERARLWLKNSDKSIQEISSELGYSSVSYFSSVFKRLTGFTPTEYRRS